MMNNPLLSIVIPAYNAENTIVNTINSVLNAFKDTFSYEIIVVENGSTDKTTQLLENIKSPNLIVLHSDKGVSKARNKGIENAKGKWLMFVDADDLVVNGYSQDFKKILKESTSDLCLFSKIVNNSTIRICDRYKVVHQQNKKDFFIEVLNKPTVYGLAYSKVYNLKTLELVGIKFDTNMKYAEDSDFVLRYIEKCNQIELFPWPLYEVVANNDSVTHSINNKKIYDYAKSMKLTKQKLSLNNADFENAYYNYCLNNFHIVMVNNVFTYLNDDSFKNKLAALKEGCKIDVFEIAIHNIKTKGSTKINALMSTLLKWHLYLLAAFVYQIRAKQKHKTIHN